MNSEPFHGKSRRELEQQFAGAPSELIDYACQLAEALAVREQALAQQQALLATTRQELIQHQQELARQEQLLAEARAYIAELKQQLFGPKADKLTPEQEEQLRQLTGDVQEQVGRPPPLSQGVLEPESAAPDKERPQRPRRHPLPPVELEIRRDVLEPKDKDCERCHRERPRIGQETTTEYDYQPAKLVVHETVRPK
jgi:hypothetical protein